MKAQIWIPESRSSVVKSRRLVLLNPVAWCWWLFWRPRYYLMIVFASLCYAKWVAMIVSKSQFELGLFRNIDTCTITSFTFQNIAEYDIDIASSNASLMLSKSSKRGLSTRRDRGISLALSHDQLVPWYLGCASFTHWVTTEIHRSIRRAYPRVNYRTMENDNC